MAEEEGAAVKSSDEWAPCPGATVLKREVCALTLERRPVLYILSRKQ